MNEAADTPVPPEDDLESRLPARAYEILEALAPTGNAAAPLLFSEEEMDRVAVAAGKHFTGTWLRTHQPRIYRAIVALLGTGSYSSREIGDLLGVSKNTVLAVAVDAPDAVGTLKQRTAATLRKVTLLMAERMLENQHLIPIGQLAVPLGIMNANAQLLEGDATAIIGDAKPSAQHAAWEELMAEVREGFRQQTDLERATAGQKGVIEGRFEVLPDRPADRVARDSETAESVAINREEPPSDTGNATEKPAAPAPDRGAGGVEDSSPSPEPFRSLPDKISPKDLDEEA